MITHASPRTLCTWAAAGLAIAATAAPAAAFGPLGHRSSGRAATTATSASATAPAIDAAPKKVRVTLESIQWSQIAHEMRYEIARDRLAEIEADRRRPLAERAREQAQRVLAGQRPVEWRLPRQPATSLATTTRRTAALDAPIDTTTSPAEANMPGGAYVPRSWNIVDTPQGPEIHVPYTFSPDIIDGFFLSPDPTDDIGFNILASLPSVLAVQIILETDLDDLPIDLNGDGVITADPANPGFDELVPLKFVGYNPLIHEQALVYDNQGIDPDLVADFLGQPDAGQLSATPRFNSIDGFGAPALQDRAGAFATIGTPGDGTFGIEFPDLGVPERPNNLTAGRVINHCSWSNVGEITRQIAFALGLTWHQTRADRDTYIDVAQESVLPTDNPDALVTQLFAFSNDSPNLSGSRIQFGSFIPASHQTFGQYDPFSIVHQDAFTLSVDGFPTFNPEPAMLQLAAIDAENQRRLGDNDPDTVPIPGSPGAPNTNVQEGLNELLFLIGFTPEFSSGDIATLAKQLELDAYFPGQNPKCPADFDGDGDQDFADLRAFAELLFPLPGTVLTEDQIAAQGALDVNLSGRLEPADFGQFFALYTSGECFEDFDPDPADVPFLEPDSCDLDVNGDGVLNFFDRVAFETLFDQGNPVTDLVSDGILNEQDLIAFSDAQLEGTCRPGLPPLVTGCSFDITGPAGGPDGEQDWLDLLEFAAIVDRGDPGADLNADLLRDFQDFNAFEAAFTIGTCRPGTAAPLSSGCLFDIDGDGDQDWVDRITYAQLFEPGNPSRLAADANNNGVVGDPPDFAVFNTDNGIFAALGTCQPGTGATAPIPNGCGLDVNADGEQTFADRAAFGDLFAAQSPAADLNGDSFIDELDIQQFNDTFQTGECTPGTPQDDGPVDDGCPLDLDNNGIQDFNDILLFVQLWNAANPAADFDGNGFIEIDDLQAFNQQFVPGFCSPNSPFPEPDNRPGTGQPVLPS